MAVSHTSEALRAALEPDSTAVSASRSPLDVEWLASPEHAESACRRYLEALRWPEGVSCPRCEGRSITDIPGRRRFRCRS